MNRIAFSIGPLQIYWYGILVATAVLISYWLTRKYIRKYGMDVDKVDSLLLKLILVIFIGARVAYVVTNYRDFINNPWEIIRVDHGGLGSHGAIIGTLLFGYYWTKRDGFDFWRIADAVAPVFPIGHIFVRVGNFINGELYGPPTTLPWGVKFPDTLVPVHPTQIYEAILSVLILPLAIKWSNNPRYPGYSFLRVLLLHSLIRILLDFIRQSSATFLGMVLTQYIALGLMLICAAIIWRKKKSFGI